MVAARPGDDEVAAMAVKWLEDNPTHQQAHELIRALVAARPGDDEVAAMARNWLLQFPNHSSRSTLLITLITRSDGASEWMQKGEDALADAGEGSKRNLVAALLSGSKAKERYVEMTLEMITHENNQGGKTFLIAKLAGALAHNIENCIRFLRNPPTPALKRTAVQAFARGLRQYPDCVEELLPVINCVPKDDTGFLLSVCIESEVPDDTLSHVLCQWLNDRQRAKGYRMVLMSLKRHPSRWHALMKLGRVKQGVRSDFHNLK